MGKYKGAGAGALVEKNGLSKELDLALKEVVRLEDENRQLESKVDRREKLLSEYTHWLVAELSFVPLEAHSDVSYVYRKVTEKLGELWGEMRKEPVKAEASNGVG